MLHPLLLLIVRLLLAMTHRPPARRLTLEELRTRPTMSIDEAVATFDVDREVIAAAFRRGDLAGFRIGRRILLSVPSLLEKIGVPTDDDEQAS